MRAMWSGNVAFGLVHIPVKMYAATQDLDVRFHQVHLADGGRIKYLRQCQVCEQVIPFAEIGKGFEDETGRRVLVSEDELDNLQVEHGRDLEIIEFAPAAQIDPMFFEKAYYLEPATGAAKPYVLLRQALERTERIAVVMMTLRKRTRLGLLRVRDDVLVLQTMLWPDEVRTPDFAGISDEDITVRPQELAMAGSLVDSLSADFDPAAHTDEYRQAVLDLVEQKLTGEDVIAPAATAETSESGTVIDLMAALQESVRRSQAARGGSESEADASSEGPDPDAAAETVSTDQTGPRTSARAAKRSAAKRAPAKRAAAKRAPAKRAAAKKAAAKRAPTKKAAG
ncbi:MAG: Ku protein [Candidatus Nanopelagicales bacterium]